MPRTDRFNRLYFVALHTSSGLTKIVYCDSTLGWIPQQGEEIPSGQEMSHDLEGRWRVACLLNASGVEDFMTALEHLDDVGMFIQHPFWDAAEYIAAVCLKTGQQTKLEPVRTDDEIGRHDPARECVARVLSRPEP